MICGILVGSSINVSAAIVFVLLSSEASRRGTKIGSYLSMLLLGPIVGLIVGAPIAAFLRDNAPHFAFAAMIALALAIVGMLAYFGRLGAARPPSGHEIDRR